MWHTLGPFGADNHRISAPQGSAVLGALALARSEYGGHENRQELGRTSFKPVIIGGETLQCFECGGRVTPVTATINTFMGVKQLLT